MHEMKRHKPWFDEECLGILDQRKRAKMQWLQDPSQSNVDTLNKETLYTSRFIRLQNINTATQLICVFYMILRTKRNYLPIQQ